MNSERAELPQDEPGVLEQIQQSGLVAALLAMLAQLRQNLPEPDTSIAWEDGEVHDADEAGR